MRRAKARQKRLALERVELLLDEALRNASRDMQIARRQAEIARRLCLRFNLRLPYEKRQLFCHGCKQLIVPGINATLRLSKERKAIVIRCLDCGFVYRKVFEDRRVGKVREKT